MTVLELVASEMGGVRLSTLCEALHAPKSSVHGLARGLVAMGYLVEHDGAYLSGPAVALLQRPSPSDGRDRAHRILADVAERSGETGILSALMGASVVYVDMVQSSQAIGYFAPLLSRRPLYPTSAGKCFLAHMDHAVSRSYISATFTDPNDVRTIEDELAEIRLSGLAFNRGESVTDVCAVATIVGGSGPFSSCIGVAGPMSRMESRLAEVGALILDAAARLAQD